MATLGTLMMLAGGPLAAQPPSTTPSRPGEASTARQLALEEAFAAFRARDLDGRVLTADSLRGRIVILDFWATWCAPCLAEVPTLQRLRRAHDPARVALIGISLDTLDRRGLIAWLNRQGVTWTQVHDRRAYNGDLPRQFQVVGLPTSYVFDGEGRLVASNLRGDRLLRAVAGLTSAESSAPRN
jgi:thiol-disulfide isomerase/thioredoxin